MPPCLSAEELIALARQADTSRPCPACNALQCPGWESMPSYFDRRMLVPAGTLRDENIEEPTLTEHHPRGTHSWSPDAPIAPACYPYHRCDVWQCSACHRTYLRYTEYGGYYEDERVRLVHPGLVTAALS